MMKTAEEWAAELGKQAAAIDEMNDDDCEAHAHATFRAIQADAYEAGAADMRERAKGACGPQTAPEPICGHFDARLGQRGEFCELAPGHAGDHGRGSRVPR